MTEKANDAEKDFSEIPQNFRVTDVAAGEAAPPVYSALSQAK